MVEPTRLRVRGKVNVAEVIQRHGSLLRLSMVCRCRDPAMFRSTVRIQGVVCGNCRVMLSWSSLAMA